MTIERTIQFRAALNRHPCEVPYCKATRFGAARHCQPHAKRYRQYGHPQGRKVYPREYAALLARVQQLFRENPRHPLLDAALGPIGQWLNDAAAGDRTAPAYAQTARLHAHGITALQVFEECAALWAYSRGGTPPDDARLDFALANAVFHLAPLELNRTYRYGDRTLRTYKSIPRADREAAGAFIRQTLFLLLDRVATTVLQGPSAAREAEIARALAAPFNHRHLTIPTT